MRMFNKILSYFDLGIKVPEAPKVSIEEKDFNNYVDWLLSLGMDELEVKLEYSRRYDGHTTVEFLTKVIAKKKKLTLLGQSVKVIKSSNYEKKVGYTERSERMVRFIVDTNREDAVGDNLKDITPEHTHPSSWIVNPAPRTYTTGTRDGTSKGRPFTDYERNTTHGHVPNPAYYPSESTYHPPSASCSPDTNTSSDSYDSGGSSSCSSD